MIALFGVAIVVIVGLVLFMFFILKSTVKKINSQTKLYFVDKLQEYDYLIDKKEEKLNLINKEIREKEIKSESDNEGFKKNTYEFDYQIIDLLRNTTISTEEIAQRYSVHKTSIDRINQGKTFVPITSQYNLPLRKSNRKSW